MLWVGGWGLFLSWWSPSTMWAGPLILLHNCRDVWIIPSFRIRDYILHAEHAPCVITNCGQHQWVIPSPLSIPLLGLAEGKHYLKTTISIFRVVLLNFVIPGCFLYIIFYRYIFSLLSSVFFILFSITVFFPYFLQVGLKLQYATLLQYIEV